MRFPAARLVLHGRRLGRRTRPARLRRSRRGHDPHRPRALRRRPRRRRPRRLPEGPPHRPDLSAQRGDRVRLLARSLDQSLHQLSRPRQGAGELARCPRDRGRQRQLRRELRRGARPALPLVFSLARPRSGDRQAMIATPSRVGRRSPLINFLPCVGMILN